MNGLNVFSGKRGNPGGISDMRHSLLLNVTWGKRWSCTMRMIQCKINSLMIFEIFHLI